MSVHLQRGQNITLSRVAREMGTGLDLEQVAVGLGWDAAKGKQPPLDLDASAFMLAENGKVPDDDHFIFYNQPLSPDKAVHYQGDNQSGAGEGDDELIVVDLERVKGHIRKIVFTVTIYEADLRRQHFGMINNAYIRIVDRISQKELTRYNLSEKFTSETAMLFGELYRYNNSWKFRAVGQGFAGGLAAMAQAHGIVPIN